MADAKISALTGASTPLAGTEVLPIVQSGATKKVSTDDLTVKNVRSNATNGILQIAGPAAAATRVMTTPDANFTVARTDAAQSFTNDQTLSTGNLVIGTSGKGIDFSATPGTGTSELLADYEEGTWTPVVAGDATAGTYEIGTAYASYTKIGRMVTVQCYIQFAGSITGGGAGSMIVSGLPYTKKANSSTAGSVQFAGVDWTAGANLSCDFGTIGGVGQDLYFVETNDNAGQTYVPISGASASDKIIFTVTYENA
jgi:hypothetical protein